MCICGIPDTVQLVHFPISSHSSVSICVFRVSGHYAIWVSLGLEPSWLVSQHLQLSRSRPVDGLIVIRLRAVASALIVIRLRAVASALIVIRLRAVASALIVIRLRAVASALIVIRLRAVASALIGIRLRAVASALIVTQLRAGLLVCRGHKTLRMLGLHFGLCYEEGDRHRGPDESDEAFERY
ncbi:hypothetical protein OROMI_031425 [Orobanche minor]